MRYKTPGMRLKLLGPHVTTALQVWLWLLLFVFQNEFRISKSSVPGYLDFDNLPDTNFTCAGKVIGGYYADVETSCQMFHVCTIGQQEEPMDIKFLCLNGTVFDQETRVCERVDEVDCSKSEKFYSLNLELYGNTAPPLVKGKDDEEDEINEESEEDYDDTEVAFIETTTTQQPTTTSSTYPTTTEQTTTQKVFSTSRYTTPASTVYSDSFEDDGFYDQYTPAKVDSLLESEVSQHQFDKEPNTQTPPKYSHGDTTHEYKHPNNPEQPHGFVSNHRLANVPTPNNEAISFQHQSFPNSGQDSQITITTHVSNNEEDSSRNRNTDNSYASKVFITTDTPQRPQKPESFQANIPFKRPGNLQPVITHTRTNLHHPPLTPHGFKPSQPTQNPPASQIQSPNTRGPSKFNNNRPIQSFQPSENHEILIDSTFKLPEGPPLGQHDYSTYHLEHNKRSHDQVLRNGAAEHRNRNTELSEEEWTPKRHVPKSPPKVIITASASVSDSNGKKLNYTVGNVVHAVQPILPANYDEFKEADVILDPFYLDVPKLKQRRPKRNAPITVDASNSNNTETNTTVTTTTLKTNHTEETSTKNVPMDYVDDNYEPFVYKEDLTKNITNANKTNEKVTNEKVTDEKVTNEKVKNEKVKMDEHKPKKTRKENEAYIREMEERLLKEVLIIHGNRKSPNKLSTGNITTIAPFISVQNHTQPTHGLNYRLIRMKLEFLGYSDDSFSCINRTMNKFYPDSVDCQTFYFCTPGYSKNQVAILMYQCDLHTYYSKDAFGCTEKKPSECKV